MSRSRTRERGSQEAAAAPGRREQLGFGHDYKSGDKLRQELVREQKEWNDVLKRLGMIKK